MRISGAEVHSDTNSPSRTWLEKYIHPDDQPNVLAVINEAIRTKSTFELEHRVIRVDGTLGWTFSRAVPLLDANGEIVEWFGAASDITERKRAQEPLRQSQEQLQAIDDEMVQVLFMTASETNGSVRVTVMCLMPRYPEEEPLAASIKALSAGGRSTDWQSTSDRRPRASSINEDARCRGRTAASSMPISRAIRLSTNGVLAVWLFSGM